MPISTPYEMNNTDTRPDDEIYAGETRAELTARHKRLRIGGIIVLLVAVVGIQLLPAGLERNNPPVTQEPAWDSTTTRDLVVRACYDCHSNETYWPWYSYVAPLSWMILQDVHKGREVLNFSEWTNGQLEQAEIEEIVELVSKDMMPLPYYEILHPEARLSSVEEGQLVNGLISTLTRDQPAMLDSKNLDEKD